MEKRVWNPKRLRAGHIRSVITKNTLKEISIDIKKINDNSYRLTTHNKVEIMYGAEKKSKLIIDKLPTVDIKWETTTKHRILQIIDERTSRISVTTARTNVQKSRECHEKQAEHKKHRESSSFTIDSGFN